MVAIPLRCKMPKFYDQTYIMKLQYLVLGAFLFGLFSSFGPTQACEYAGSNIDYVGKEIKKALGEKNLQLTRFHIYRALDAISKTKEKLEKCDCGPASEIVAEVKELLKYATKASSVTGAGNLLDKALHLTENAVTALDDHEQHNSAGNTDLLNMPHSDERKDTIAVPPSEKILERKIDSALAIYRASLNKVITSVNCREAQAFANRIYENCQQELLKIDLSEGKKYYNLRTKEITVEALTKLGDCEK